jgi:hypothetical protein
MLVTTDPTGVIQMNRFTLRVALALALLFGGSGPIVAAEDTHTTHSKQMKNDAGVTDGEQMKNADRAGTGSPPATGTRCRDKGKSHTSHSKQMKNDAGVKEGEPMDNVDCIDSSTQESTEKPVSNNTHTTHSKQMKNDQGAKDGERMENAH